MVALKKTFKKYDRHKSTGISWLGTIPEGWEVKRLKFIADITLGKMLQDKDSDGDVQLCPYLKAQNVEWFSVDLSDVREMYFSEYERKRLRLLPGDLLVSEGGEVGRTSMWHGELPECYIQNSINRVRVDRANAKYILFVCSHLGNSGVFDAVVNRVSIAHLTKDKLKEISFPLPPKEEQEKIVSYLDEKTALIDEIIAKKKEQIDLLEQEKISVIQNAISSVGGERRKLKYCVRTNPEVLSEDAPGGLVFPYVDIGGVDAQNGILNPVFMAFSEAPSRARRIVRDQDVIVASVRTYLKAVAHIQKPAENLVVSTGFTVLRPLKGMLGRFLYYSVVAENFISEVVARSVGVSYPGINSSEMTQIFITLPPISEQEMIMKTLDSSLESNQKIIATIRESIDGLEEYRFALIASVITGKVKVI